MRKKLKKQNRKKVHGFLHGGVLNQQVTKMLKEVKYVRIDVLLVKLATA